MRADYIEETTTSIAGTGGNGAVTLTQITGLPRFSTAFGTSARFVEYAIEDTVNLYFERGLGNVSSNVLTRTQPRVTWNGTTYDDTSPSALAFGSSPASGNIKIRMAPMADSAVPPPAWHTSSLTGSAYDLGLTCGDIVGGPDSSRGFGLDSETWFPFLWLGTREIDQFALRAPSSNTGRSVKFCLSEVNSSKLPGRKLLDFGAISFNTSGTKTVSSGSFSPSGDAKLPVGHYYIGMIADGSVDVNCVENNRTRASILGMSNYERPLPFVSRGSGDGASYATGLGDSPSGLTASNYYRPVVYLRPKA
jgi:hypothetical protein